jgi:hypothetical protein
VLTRHHKARCQTSTWRTSSVFQYPTTAAARNAAGQTSIFGVVTYIVQGSAEPPFERRVCSSCYDKAEQSMYER